MCLKKTIKFFTLEYAVFFNVLLHNQIFVGTCPIIIPVTWSRWKLDHVCLHCPQWPHLPYISIIRIPVNLNRYLVFSHNKCVFY